MMQAIIGLIWLVGTAYAAICIIKPLKPFRRRWQAALSLVGVQLVVGVLAAPFVPKQTSVPSTPPIVQPVPASPVRDGSHDGDVTIVPSDPHAPDRPPSHAAVEDARRARVEMKDHLRLIDAGEAVLVSGVNAGNREAVELVHRDMTKLGMKLTARRPTYLNGEPWPDADNEAHYACDRAAWKLSEFARSLLEPLTIEGAAARTKISDEYHKALDKCRAWVGE